MAEHMAGRWLAKVAVGVTASAVLTLGIVGIAQADPSGGSAPKGGSTSVLADPNWNLVSPSADPTWDAKLDDDPNWN
ncbi:hypothetical protein ABT160_04680 [Streptomyces sp. NPDC001941]|uniref:hypothetical protein n=1 Tax=Streptomyces sp. NPDC001941 TaxID=3154659 RepID=UPI0033265A5C